MKLILASGSPRRKELLAAAGLDFEVIPSPAEELHDVALGMAGLCEENARRKASAIAVNHPACAIIGADTLVFSAGEALGKPKTIQQAAAMLRKLSGRKHQVCTGVCIAGPEDQVELFHETTDVYFRELSEPLILEYIKKTNPLDKAGAYGIQDHGEMIVEKIVGAFDNVMGLPVERVLSALKEIGLPIETR